MKRINIFGIALITVSMLFSACQMQNDTEDKQINNEMTKEATMPEIDKAICVLHPTEGNTASGTVTFTKTADGIRINAEMTGLSEGKHGFHIHQLGDCSAPDGTSAGGHFDPENMPHGRPNDAERHVGDLGNIEAGADGNATLSMTDNLIAFQGEHSIIGRAIIVHAGEDDLTSQPTGAAGARVACGVIGIDVK